jgi:hypothetical protein
MNVFATSQRLAPALARYGSTAVVTRCRFNVLLPCFPQAIKKLLHKGLCNSHAGTVSERRGDPAFFSASSFSGPEGDVNNHLSFETKITLTAPAIRRLPPGGYILTIQAPIFGKTLSFTPNAVLENGTYHITASSSQNYAFLTLFAPIAIDL